MSLRLNRSEPIFRPKRELPGIGEKLGQEIKASLAVLLKNLQ